MLAMNAHDTLFSSSMNRLYEARKHRRLSQEQLAVLCSTSQQNIDRWEKKPAVPTRHIKMLSAMLRVPEASLISSDVVFDAPENIQWAPVISWAQAGQLAKNEPFAFDAKDYEPFPWHRSSIVALKVQGTSMNNVAPPGSTVVVDYEDRLPIDGHVFLIMIDDEVTLKRYRDTKGPVRLEPDSSDRAHETIFPTGEFIVLGRCVRVTTDPNSRR